MRSVSEWPEKRATKIKLNGENVLKEKIAEKHSLYEITVNDS